MKDFLNKAPFVKLLTALLGGILLQYYIGITQFLPFILTIAVLAIATSFFLPKRLKYKLNWLFGVGIFMLVCAFGIYSTEQRQQQTHFLFSKQARSYIGTVSDIPQTKPRSIACRIVLQDPQKHKITVYFGPDSLSKTLKVGDRVLFYATVQPFKNRGNPDDFNYVAYMQQLGFSGTTYLAANRWKKLDAAPISVYALSQQVRTNILDFYRKLNLGHDKFTVFSALTLGYKEELDESVLQAFRASGTSHILSVSGLHVGIIYLVIASLFGFLPNTRKWNIARQVLIVLFLWSYAFLTGLPPSVVRACTMITVFCIAIALRKKAFSYNTVCFTAFIMLLIHPFDLFQIGFQLSFAAVLSICFFLPIVLKMAAPRHRLRKLVWDTAAVSLAVQLGTYPICLYYFGTFPTYFFLTNIVMVPLATFTIYSSLGIGVAAGLSYLFPAFSGQILLLPVCVLKMLLFILLGVARITESLPFALIQNTHIDLWKAFLLIFLSISAVLFLQNHRPKTLMWSLSLLSVFLFLSLPLKSKEENKTLYVFNRSDKLEIGKVGGKNFVLDSTNHSAMTLVNVVNRKIAVIKTDIWLGQKAEDRFQVDYLILSGKDSISLYHLSKLFDSKLVILDGTLSSRTSRRLQRECKKLQIEWYDVKEKGAFRIKN